MLVKTLIGLPEFKKNVFILTNTYQIPRYKAFFYGLEAHLQTGESPCFISLFNSPYSNTKVCPFYHVTFCIFSLYLHCSWIICHKWLQQQSLPFQFPCLDMPLIPSILYPITTGDIFNKSEHIFPINLDHNTSPKLFGNKDVYPAPVHSHHLFFLHSPVTHQYWHMGTSWILSLCPPCLCFV